MSMRARALSLLLCFTFGFAAALAALDRQPGADYRARRVALARQLDGGVVVMFGGIEPEGPDAIYGFRQDNDFFYLTGWDEPGAALLIAPGVIATGLMSLLQGRFDFFKQHDASNEEEHIRPFPVGV